MGSAEVVSERLGPGHRSAIELDMADGRWNLRKYEQAPAATLERIRSRVVVAPGGCWRWPGAKTNDGYGIAKYRLGGRQYMVYVHRLLYWKTVGPVVEGVHLDHLCRNRSCVNPGHLQPVTCAENLNRGHHYRRHVSGTDRVNNPWSKGLTAADVLAIRASADSWEVLAARFNTSKWNIAHIKKRESWVWVEEEGVSA